MHTANIVLIPQQIFPLQTPLPGCELLDFTYLMMESKRSCHTSVTTALVDEDIAEHQRFVAGWSKVAQANEPD